MQTTSQCTFLAKQMWLRLLEMPLETLTAFAFRMQPVKICLKKHYAELKKLLLFHKHKKYTPQEILGLFLYLYSGVTQGSGFRLYLSVLLRGYRLYPSRKQILNGKRYPIYRTTAIQTMVDLDNTPRNKHNIFLRNLCANNSKKTFGNNPMSDVGLVIFQ